ncbi:hypothetical protein ACQQ2N_12790 [Dokdonella sp. MW10]|uniref:hypothetical protein n=1 Tax=Dokdonella sp. MW10 TaxID=2992926 RepID=UPI003F81CE1B
MKKTLLVASLLLAFCATAQAETTFKRGAARSAVPAGTVGQSLPERGGTTITQNTSLAAVADTGAACADPDGFTTENSFYRRFNLAALGASGAASVTNVDIAIEAADSASGGSQPLQVRLYTIPAAAPLTLANLTQIGTATAQVSDQSLAALSVPISGSIADAAATHLVVEIHTADGTAAGDVLMPGFNSAGQSAPTYAFAEDCGDTEITDLAAVGFGPSHIIMAVTGSGLPVSLQSFDID